MADGDPPRATASATQKVYSLRIELTIFPLLLATVRLCRKRAICPLIVAVFKKLAMIRGVRTAKAKFIGASG
jgi:hypothetical protein